MNCGAGQRGGMGGGCWAGGKAGGRGAGALLEEVRRRRVGLRITLWVLPLSVGSLSWRLAWRTATGMSAEQEGTKPRRQRGPRADVFGLVKKN